MTLHTLIEKQPLILMEGAVVERLRRAPEISIDPCLLNAPLIYNERGRQALTAIYQQYIDIAAGAGLPMLLCTPTWRADRERILDSNCPETLNIDAARFMRSLYDTTTAEHGLFIGGLLGCKNDCYQPQQALSTEQAEQFHRWQAEQLTLGGVDFLIAETLPSMHEALGLARAMQHNGLPYIISFVIDRRGCLLDGHRLDEAFQFIDSQTDVKPLGYMVNCAYPGFLCAEQQNPRVFQRLLGFLANASALDHCDLDQAEDVQMNPIEEWVEQMLILNQRYGVKMLGGCCGTDDRHLDQLVSAWRAQALTGS